MEQEVPQQLKTAAIVQLVSGLVNWFMMAFISYFTLGIILGVCTFWIGGLGAICGMWGCLLVPIGIFEVVAGVMGLTNPKGAGQIMKYASYAEMAGVIFGGIPGAIAGFLVQKWLSEPDVVAFLEAPEA
jgi:hypothetical protein